MAGRSRDATTSAAAAHPCHPSVVNDETERGFYGGIKAKQNIVCALYRGDDAIYARGEALARTVFRPVVRSHRITVEQMAILEPAMAETVTLTSISTIREVMDQAIRVGVPESATCARADQAPRVADTDQLRAPIARCREYLGALRDAAGGKTEDARRQQELSL